MGITQEIDKAKKDIENLKKKYRTRGILIGLFFGLTIGISYTMATIAFQKIWSDYQEALKVMNELPAWKAEHGLSFSGVMVPAVAHAETIGDKPSVATSNEEVTPTLVEVIATTYNAEEAQTDGDPFTMASGHRVYEGAVASNCLPLNTKIRINGQTFVVEDRMNSRFTQFCGTDQERLDIFKWDKKDNFKKTMTYEKI